MRRLSLAASGTTLAILTAVAAFPAQADTHMESWTVDLTTVTQDGTGESVGTVTISPADEGGTAFQVAVTGLQEGAHGFHVHENGSCEPSQNDQGEIVPGGAAGSHWDPDGTGTHQGPEGDGHLGDLPSITADADGAIDETVIAPRIEDMSQLAGLAVIIHQGGDTYSDEPKLGGGGARMVCGVIPAQQ